MNKRLCVVGNQTGYFHMWEQYSEPVEESPLKGGRPAGVFSRVYGIVEFEDCVRRVDPTDINFCDEVSYLLHSINKETQHREEEQKDDLAR